MRSFRIMALTLALAALMPLPARSPAHCDVDACDAACCTLSAGEAIAPAPCCSTGVSQRAAQVEAVRMAAFSSTGTKHAGAPARLIDVPKNAEACVSPVSLPTSPHIQSHRTVVLLV